MYLKHTHCMQQTHYQHSYWRIIQWKPENGEQYALKRQCRPPAHGTHMIPAWSKHSKQSILEDLSLETCSWSLQQNETLNTDMSHEKPIMSTTHKSLSSAAVKSLLFFPASTLIFSTVFYSMASFEEFPAVPLQRKWSFMAFHDFLELAQEMIESQFLRSGESRSSVAIHTLKITSAGRGGFSGVKP